MSDYTVAIVAAAVACLLAVFVVHVLKSKAQKRGCKPKAARKLSFFNDAVLDPAASTPGPAASGSDPLYMSWAQLEPRLAASGTDYDVLIVLFHADYCNGCQIYKPLLMKAIQAVADDHPKVRIECVGIESAASVEVVRALKLSPPQQVPIVAITKGGSAPWTWYGAGPSEELTEAATRNFLDKWIETQTALE